MLLLVLLWGLLPGKAVWCLTGPSSVSVRSRTTMTVRCDYDEGYEHYIKYWCKGESFSSCAVQITATEHNREISRGRFTIRDTQATRSLYVTMRDVTPTDADTYYCAIQRNLKDNRHRVEVTVLPGFCRATAPWTDTVVFPSHFTEIQAYRVVEVACREGYEKKNITLQCREEYRGFYLSARSDADYCTGVCRKSPPWTDIVDFPENFTEIAEKDSVVVSCQQRYQEKKLRLQCREKAGRFLLSPEDGQGSCVGVCRKSPPWTDIVDFPDNFTEIAVNGSVVVSCQQRYEEKKLRLQCQEEAGRFLLSAEGGQGSCVGVCRKSPSWTDIVDFPENFTEIAVNGSVVVSCQQRYEEKKLRLQCREEAGRFLLSSEDGQPSCTGNKMSELIKRMRFLLTSTIGFVVPFLVKLVVLVMMLIVKMSSMINERLRGHRKGQEMRTSLEMRSMDVQQKSGTSRAQDGDSQQMEVEQDEDYENVNVDCPCMSRSQDGRSLEDEQDEDYENITVDCLSSQPRNTTPNIYR